jgi:hypothetical protein
MAFDIYQGDPKLDMTIDGTRIVFVGGQPRMDQGLENLALISLFTRRNWPGNILFSDQNQKIGSDFEEAVNQPITLSALNAIRDAAEKALRDPAFGNVSVIVTNPVHYRLDIDILIDPPASNQTTLLLSRHGQNWILQSSNPAYRRV